MSSGEETVRAWRDSAPYWEKHAERIAAIFKPITEGLATAAGLRPGQRVLDVAGGSGEPSLTVAPLVGAAGLAVYSDVADGMVAGARRRAAARGETRLRFVQCAGQALPFVDRAFDAVVCRLGVMFFPDPGRGVSEMLRVSRGVVAVAVWGAKERNPYFAVPSEVVSRYAGSPPDPPGAPNAWRFGEPGLLAGIFAGAGAREVREERLGFDIVAPLSFEEFWRMRVELSDTLRETTARIGRDATRRVASEVRDAFATYFEGGTMRIPAEVLVVSGSPNGRE